MSPFVPQRMIAADAFRCRQNKQNLKTLTEFIEDGKITPVIDRRYPFEEIPAAVRYQEEGHAAGKVVIALAARSSTRNRKPGRNTPACSHSIG